MRTIKELETEIKEADIYRTAKKVDRYIDNRVRKINTLKDVIELIDEIYEKDDKFRYPTKEELKARIEG